MTWKCEKFFPVFNLLISRIFNTLIWENFFAEKIEAGQNRYFCRGKNKKILAGKTINKGIDCIPGYWI
jgi:hypothetical protein